MQATMDKTQAMVEHLAAVNVILEKNDFNQARLIPIL
jgi:NADH-quinone oxidoreductase subunit E